MSRRSRTAWLLAAGALVAGTAGAAAPAWPTRPVRLLIPFPPGGGADTLARIVTPRLTEALGQPWVVDNRGGAAGNLATEVVVNASPDGHTALLGFNTVLTVNPSLYKLTHSIERDLRPVSMMASAQYILVVHASVPVASFKEFVALARQKPGTLNYASAGTGSPLHLAAELLKKRAGIDIVHVAYKGGGPAAAAVLAGETQLLFGSIASSLQHVKAGRLRGLAATGAKRSEVVPELPTIAESGYPGFDVSSWYALLVPAATPATIVERLRTEVQRALAHPDVQQGMTRQGMTIETGGPAEVAARIKRETAEWAGVIRDANIRVQ